MIEFKIRKFKQADSLLLKELDSDMDVMRYISNGIVSSDSEIERATKVMLSYNSKNDGQTGYWIIEETISREFIGWVHLRPLHSNPENFEKLEIGYRLKKKFWGKGIATKVSKFMIDKAFMELYAKEVWAMTMQANKASQRVMEKCHLKFHSNYTYEDFPGKDKQAVWYFLENGIKT